jgi:hypothetical protein
MALSVPGVPASCEKFPHSSPLNFWSTESIFNQFSVLLKTLNALCVCLQYKHPGSIKRVIRSDKPVTLLLLLWPHKCDIGAEPRSRIIANSAVKGLNSNLHLSLVRRHILQKNNNNNKKQPVLVSTSWFISVRACLPENTIIPVTLLTLFFTWAFVNRC